MSIFPPAPTPPADETTLSTAQYTSTIVLNRVFKIILKMVNALQNVAAVQAQRLSFMADWQKSYTDLMAQVHTFVKGDGNLYSQDTTDASEARDNLNQLNTTYTTTLQNRQSIVSDDAKALQSNVNQSNEAVSQHLTLANTILDQLKSLLGAIFSR